MMTISKGDLSKEDLSASDVKPVHQKLDWNDLRARSVQKGGFGEERVTIWPKLLHVSESNIQAFKAQQLDENPPHQDERQIGLDTDRSFVLYPVEPKIDREALQNDLNKLLVSLFRKRPRLSYFQGYHDIVTVLFLTLPPELQLLCAEKLSLHRLRDSMGSGLEPVLGLLRVTKNLLRLADPDYANLLERNSPLPFYALSNLLTLFAHDMPTLPLIQHVFDFLLCRPPISAVYLATAIILSRKKDVLRLEEEDEDGMIHSLLSSLPHLMDDPDEEKDDEDEPPKYEEDEEISDVDNTFFKEELKTEDKPSISILELPSGLPLGSIVKLEDEEDFPNLTADSIAVISENPSDISQDATPQSAGSDINEMHTDLEKIDGTPDLDGEKVAHLPSSQSSEIPQSNVLDVSINPAPKIEDDHNVIRPKLTKLYLTDLLKEADVLYNKFPPTHSKLALTSIMGPQSVVFTWSESLSGLPSDNTAEAMVSHPELVVYPYKETNIQDQKEESSNKEGAGKSPRRRRRKLTKSPFGQVEKKTMLAGTVLVLGVAMAVYGMKARQASPGGAHGPLSLYGFVDGRPHVGSVKDWKRLGGWIGGALAGVSEKVLNGLSARP